MDKEMLRFGDIEIEKNKFYHNKTRIFGGRCIYKESVSI